MQLVKSCILGTTHRQFWRLVPSANRFQGEKEKKKWKGNLRDIPKQFPCANYFGSDEHWIFYDIKELY